MIFLRGVLSPALWQSLLSSRHQEDSEQRNYSRGILSTVPKWLNIKFDWNKNQLFIVIERGHMKIFNILNSIPMRWQISLKTMLLKHLPFFLFLVLLNQYKDTEPLKIVLPSEYMESRWRVTLGLSDRRSILSWVPYYEVIRYWLLGKSLNLFLAMESKCNDNNSTQDMGHRES